MATRHHRRRRGPSSTPATPVPTELLTLTVGEPAHGGACVARADDGRVIFVRHTLPGETVRVRLTRMRNTLAWGDAIEILDPSEDRIDPIFPQAGPDGVGGAELSHVRPAAQRQWKETVLAGQIRRIGGEDLATAVDAIGGIHVQPAIGDDTPGDPLTHRRTRIELAIDADGRAGMHRHHHRDILPLDHMPLAHESINALGLFGANSPWANRWTAGERIRALAPTGDNPVVLIGNTGYGPDGTPTDTALKWNVNVRGEVLNYQVRADGFWQTHLRGPDTLAHAVLGASGATGTTLDGSLDGANVLELYSGAGLFSAVLGHAVGSNGQVLTLEGDDEAVINAQANTSHTGVVDTYAGAVDPEGVLDLAGELGHTPDLLVMDPPRSGAEKGVIETIGQIGPTRVVLISCDPAAGARDLARFTKAGYDLDSIHAWDLFPHTHHVEFVASLLRK
ncbi:MAG: TRAM domain-containing protein [Actinomycetaceae bacterium]|nr:TRAM domain-containing protein [Actinomycetaceae bacterium]